MGRKQRIWIPNYFYHIVCRGNRRDSLFKDDNDFVAFIYILQKVHEKYPFEMIAYCFMTNHFHLQFRSMEQPVFKIMSLINKRYANYYNTKYRLTGHVFEKRYYDKIIPNKQGMLEVSKYIHRNPVEAHMVAKPEQYKWSSFPFYQEGSAVNYGFLNTDLLLSYYSGSLEEKHKLYREFVCSGS